RGHATRPHSDGPVALRARRAHSPAATHGPPTNDPRRPRAPGQGIRIFLAPEAGRARGFGAGLTQSWGCNPTTPTLAADGRERRDGRRRYRAAHRGPADEPDHGRRRPGL